MEASIERIKLKVGGKLFETTAATLCFGGPDFLLFALSRRPFDRDSEIFSALLSLLCFDRLPSTEPCFSKQEFTDEALYYSLNHRLRFAVDLTSNVGDSRPRSGGKTVGVVRRRVLVGHGHDRGLDKGEVFRDSTGRVIHAKDGVGGVNEVAITSVDEEAELLLLLATVGPGGGLGCADLIDQFGAEKGLSVAVTVTAHGGATSHIVSYGDGGVITLIAVLLN